jgi:pimeloyl-ACP methyl ester carboxylesterase
MDSRKPFLALAAAAALTAAPPAAAAAPSPSVSAPVRVVHVGHRSVGYRAFGSGPPLVLVMGLAGTIDAWDPALVDALAAHHRVIAFDNRGIGRSTGSLAHLSIHTMAEDANGLISALKLSRPDVLGWSMGGFISQDLAIHHPGSVRRLILAASNPPAPFITLPGPDVLGLLTSPTPDLAQILALLFPPDQQAAQAAYVSRILQYPHFYLITVPTFQAQLGAVIKWGTQRNRADDPRHISRPTLVADGDKDRLTPPANSRTLARRIPHAKLIIYRDAAHGFLSQDHAAFARAVTKFLR